MNSLEVGQLIVVCVDAGTEEEAGIAAIDNLRTLPKLDKVGLILLITGGDEAMYLLWPSS